jgi:signal transduction histidine kinase
MKQERAVAQLELELARQRIELNSQRADLVRLQKQSADLKEANKHLVIATLAAQRLEAEGQEAKRRQDEFLAMLAHELRNPLAPLRSAVSLLERLQTAEPELQVIQEVMSRQVEHGPAAGRSARRFAGGHGKGHVAKAANEGK